MKVKVVSSCIYLLIVSLETSDSTSSLNSSWSTAVVGICLMEGALLTPPAGPLSM